MPGNKVNCGPGHEYSIVNNRIFFVVPLIIAGICFNETLNFVKHEDWTGLIVVIICFGAAITSLLRITTQRHYFYPIIIVIGVAIFVSSAFLILIMIQLVGENLGFVDRHNNLSNETACIQPPKTNDTEISDNDAESPCYEAWIEDVKSSGTLFGQNLFLMLNTLLMRPTAALESD